MNCKKCNQEIDENVKFCPICGADQEEVVADTVAAEAPQQAVSQPETAQQAPYMGGTATPENTAYGYTNNNTNSTYQTMEKRINTTMYMVLSILTTLCCCLPLGIASIVYATKISSAQNAGQFAEAEEYAKKAKMFMIIGVVVGFIVTIIYSVVVIGGLGSGGSYYY